MSGMRRYIELVEDWSVDAAEFLADQLGVRNDSGFSDEFLYCLFLFTNSLDGIHQEKDPAARDRINQAFDREMPVLAAGQRLFRGIGIENWAALHPMTDFRQRKTVRFPNHVSASKRLAGAAQFMNYWRGGQGNVRILFDIRTMPGARGIDVLDFRHYDIIDHGFGKAEQEVVLHRSAEYRVAGTTERDWPPRNFPMREPDARFTHVKLEQIG